MRIESSVTSVSWIPRDAIEGMVRMPFELGVAHYDLPPPDRPDDLEALIASSAIRFANVLRAYIEVDDDGRITGHGHLGQGHMGYTRMRLAGIDLTFCGMSFPEKNPWGDEESPAVVTAVESVLERELSRIIIGSDPPFRRLRRGEALVGQGDPGDELYLLFDGILAVEQDGKLVAEVGPGAILGEMAVLEGGRRTATLRAVTACRVAVVPGDRIDRTALAEVARRRRDGS